MVRDRTTAPPDGGAVALPQPNDGRGGRIPEYDVLRVVAIVAVIAIHVLAAGIAVVGEQKAPDAVLVSKLLRFAVPAFAFMTGALVWTAVPPSPARWPRFLLRRLRAVLLPYLAWSAVYLGISISGPRYHPVPAGVSLANEVAHRLVLGTPWYHLYFVPVVMMLYLAALVFGPLARRSPLAAMVAGIAVAWIGLRYGLPYLSGHRTIQSLARLLLLYLPYASVGAWYESRRRRGTLPLARVFPVLLLAGFGGRYAVVRTMVGGSLEEYAVAAVAFTFVILGILGTAQAVVPRVPRLGAALETPAGLAYAVYLSHPLLLLVVQEALTSAGAQRLWIEPAFALAMLVGLTGVTFSLGYVLSKSPVTAWSVGASARRREPGLRPA